MASLPDGLIRPDNIPAIGNAPFTPGCQISSIASEISSRRFNSNGRPFTNTSTIGFPAFFFQSLLFFLLDAFQELRDTVVEFETCVPKPFRLRVDTLSPSAVIQFHAAFYAVQNVCKGVSCVELLMNRVRF